MTHNATPEYVQKYDTKLEGYSCLLASLSTALRIKEVDMTTILVSMIV